MKKIITTTSLMVMGAGLILAGPKLTPEQKSEVKAMQQQVSELRKAHSAQSKELKSKKKELSESEYKQLEQKTKKAKAKLKAKQKELKARRVQLGLVKPKTDAKKKSDKKSTAKEKAKAPKKSKAKAETMKAPPVRFPGDLELKDGTVLQKVSVLQVSKSKIVVSDSRQANREVAIKNLTKDSRKKLKL